VGEARRILHEEDGMLRQGEPELLGMAMIIETDTKDGGRYEGSKEFCNPDRGTAQLQTRKEIPFEHFGQTFLLEMSEMSVSLFIEKMEDFHGKNSMPYGMGMSIKINNEKTKSKTQRIHHDEEQEGHERNQIRQ